MEIEAVYSPTTNVASTTIVEASMEGDKNSRFPCIEQPTRVALHCNGYYIWSKKSGKAVCKKKRNEKDEFLLIYDENENVTIQHHKYKGILTLVRTVLPDGTVEKKIRCLQNEEDKQEEVESNEVAEEKKEEPEDSTPTVAPASDGEDDEDDDEDDAVVVDPTTIQEGDQKWVFIKGASNSINGNAVILKSLSTGLILGISEEGKLELSEPQEAERTSKMQWSIECVTGELCFLSNPRLNAQLRCDMTGLINMDGNQKGWEVFRFMEAGNGYVKISSWMHSQWLLCSTKDGKVSTCTHAESFQDYRPPDENENDADGQEEKQEASSSSSLKEYRCSKWAIERSPNGDGVVIRSKTHGRFLCVKDNFELRTYHPDDDEAKETNNTDESSDEEEMKITPEDSSSTNKKSEKSSFKDSMKTLQDSMKTSMRKGIDDARKSMAAKGPRVAEVETTVWHLEAAHSQTYFFLSLNMQDLQAKAKSIGPKLQVTSNLRKNTKITLVREDNNITKLCVESSDTKAKQQFLACQEDGTIALVNNGGRADAEWIIGKSTLQEGFTTFYNPAHGLYLSSMGQDAATTKAPSKTDKLNSLLRKDKEVVEVLQGSETLCISATWRLDPVMPRAVSSEKVKAFAIGTGIAVGTTVAMPFALAGVAGIMGAIGAEVGTFTTLIFAGLTGAEAIASVGAIGATAYIIFKPDENSLTDGHNKEEEEKAKAWSQRPFSNWRNW
ncbi:unnamed protein product [Cylindrotheca closterium]|uniref:Uncharacterized protein n=1 Tax=Cylindrotheca closterium TaxID=2856 RepID=A0AAD2CMN4_9STRA|nr:unnamed protein product [Cylindrotheca closterium]